MVHIRDNLTLRACRLIANIKAEDMAATVGVTIDTWYKWEKGRSFPNAPQMAKILDYFEEKGFIVHLNEIKFFTE